MTVREINDYLVKEGYIVTISDCPLLTNKYFRDILKSDETEVLLPVIQDAKIAKREQRQVTLAAGKELFKKFAEDAHVPFRVPDGRGGNYTVKTYSIDATKLFVKVLERIAKGELQYDILCASTRLYYAAGGYKKTLSNYFIEDVWEGEYSEFKKKLEECKIEKHINKGLGKPKFGSDI